MKGRASGSRGRLGLVVALLASAGTLSAVVIACAPDDAPSQAGEECFAATDCAAGLVCVPQRSGARICSNDLTQVTGRPPAEAGASEAGEGGEAGDATTDTEPPTDAPIQDTGKDTSTVMDTGVVDAGDAG